MGIAREDLGEELFSYTKPLILFFALCIIVVQSLLRSHTLLLY